ncbi:hypothetical protein MHI48_29650 [Paenibacillus sp. FSL H7-0942]|nr:MULTISPECIES: hypothetical protein [Paenibacillus]ETT35042.1 hypothetical protein C161_17589 [Paenibacillus sp. FSL R5-192]ETT49719.1 hypothetical protein C170_17532 [Paenibacillus sp. FSL H7-689]OMF02988.1 hypothetical protein BK129_22770 [Paenibacillus amylolyticus]
MKCTENAFIPIEASTTLISILEESETYGVGKLCLEEEFGGDNASQESFFGHFKDVICSMLD